MSTNAVILIAALSTIIGALIGTGGIYAWLKVGPERKKLTVDINSSLLRDAQAAYQQLSDELNQVKMANIMLENEGDGYRDRIFQLEHVVKTLQEDIGRHGHRAELAMRRAHIALHALGGYEMHIEYLLDRMRAEDITLTALDRPIKLRRELQAKMNEVEALESARTTEALARIEIPITDADDPASE